MKMHKKVITYALNIVLSEFKGFIPTPKNKDKNLINLKTFINKIDYEATDNR